ncbi:unnamed protein product [Auanema sp. JU1783]|nr:unnamed protein product [Auanema sp. JU1783]
MENKSADINQPIDINDVYNPLPIILIVFLVVYLCIVFIAFVLVLKLCPGKLKQKPSNFSIPLPPTFMDCSFITICFPCLDCSLRSLLRALCPSREKLERLKANCSCQRPDQWDFVCCVCV